MTPSHGTSCSYGVATISRLLKIISLFCKRALQKKRYSAKETYNFKKPTNRSHLIEFYVYLFHCCAPYYKITSLYSSAPYSLLYVLPTIYNKITPHCISMQTYEYVRSDCRSTCLWVPLLRFLLCLTHSRYI